MAELLIFIRSEISPLRGPRLLLHVRGGVHQFLKVLRNRQHCPRTGFNRARVHSIIFQFADLNLSGFRYGIGKDAICQPDGQREIFTALRRVYRTLMTSVPKRTRCLLRGNPSQAYRRTQLRLAYKSRSPIKRAVVSYVTVQCLLGCPFHVFHFQLNLGCHVFQLISIQIGAHKYRIRGPQRDPTKRLGD